jgi:hypothetical protein
MIKPLRCSGRITANSEITRCWGKGRIGDHTPGTELRPVVRLNEWFGLESLSENYFGKIPEHFPTLGLQSY